MPKRPPPQRPVTLPTRFEPQMWVNADQRTAIVREIRRRHDTLVADAGVDSYQKQLLAERAIFISVQLETMEVNASNGGEFAAGTYSALTNSLVALLKTLGIEKRMVESPWLEPEPKRD